jgi:hypothetical protein
LRPASQLRVIVACAELDQARTALKVVCCILPRIGLIRGFIEDVAVRVVIVGIDLAAQVLFLPNYSPDFFPLEETFSKLKIFLRQARARTHEILQEAIGQSLLTLTSQDARGGFEH